MLVAIWHLLTWYCCSLAIYTHTYIHTVCASVSLRNLIWRFSETHLCQQYTVQHHCQSRVWFTVSYILYPYLTLRYMRACVHAYVNLLPTLGCRHDIYSSFVVVVVALSCASNSCNLTAGPNQDLSHSLARSLCRFVLRSSGHSLRIYLYNRRMYACLYVYMSVCMFVWLCMYVYMSMYICISYCCMCA